MKSPMRDFGPGLGEVPIEKSPCLALNMHGVYVDPMEVLKFGADAEMASRKGLNLKHKEIQRRDSTIANFIILYINIDMHKYIYICICMHIDMLQIFLS